MVRRHRVIEDEIKWVSRAAFNQLIHLEKFFDSEGVGEEAQALFMFLWRIRRHSRGNPAYPEITKDVIHSFIEENMQNYLLES